MKILVLTCLDPNSVGKTTGGCKSSSRRWAEIDIPDSTFWTELIQTFNQEYFNQILLGSLTALTLGFGSGLVLNVIRKGRNLL